MSERDKVLTFVPDKPLALDGVYQLNLVGLTDLLGRPIAARSILLTTFTPRKLSTYQMFDVTGAPVPFGDLAVARPLGPTAQTFLTAVPAVRGVAPLNLIDVTDPAHPVKTGRSLQFRGAQARPGQAEHAGHREKASQRFARADSFLLGSHSARDEVNGDLAVVSSSTTSASAHQFLRCDGPGEAMHPGRQDCERKPGRARSDDPAWDVQGVVFRAVSPRLNTTGVAAYS